MPSNELVAITGGTGFIGSHIFNLLLANGYRMRVLARKTNNMIINHPNVEIIIGDLHNSSSLQKLVSNVDFIIHCAGRVRGASATPFIHDNVHGTKNIISAATQANVSKFVLISSLAARIPTISDYANSKYTSECALIQSDLRHWTIIRPPAVYGPGDTELKPVFDWMKHGVLWVPGSANQLFSLMHVTDLCTLIMSQLNLLTESRTTVEPDDGHQYSWQHIQRISESFFQRKIRMICVPGSILSLVAYSNVLFSKVLNYSPILTPGKVRELLHNNWVSEGASYISNWSPKMDLKIGLGTLYSNDDDN